MANPRSFQASFNGGEVTPDFWGQIADGKYKNSAAKMRNFIAAPHGPAYNRPGTEFVSEVKTSSKRTRLIPFTYSTAQTMVIELGAGYFRFHTQGATLEYPATPAWNSATAYVVGDLVNDGTWTYYCTVAHTNHTPPNASYWYTMPATQVYEIPNIYAEADLFDIKYVQYADVLTLVHPNYPAYTLNRLGATKWTFKKVWFDDDAPYISGITATNTTGTGSTTYKYTVTAGYFTGVEGGIDAYATCTNDLLTTGNKNTVSWPDYSAYGVNWYNVYKESQGVFGYIGQTTGTSFVDDNIAADISKCPPQDAYSIYYAGQYPGAVTYFEQRKIFGGSTLGPQTVTMTATGTETGLGAAFPAVKDNDALQIKIAARDVSTIRHLVPMAELIALTSSAEIAISGDPITPKNIMVKPRSYIGANNVQPMVVNNNLIFAAARGGHIRELAYSFQSGGYITGDLSLRAPHLFDRLDIVDMAYAKAPTPICWFVSSNGKLLGLTYVPEQEVGAWHQHDTDGVFESCTVVHENGEDVLYLVVKRTLGYTKKRYIERLHSRQFTYKNEGFFVDCGLRYVGPAATTFSGLDHLEGKTVSILGDGATYPPQVVTGGTVTIDHAANNVNIGLPITAELQTLPLAVPTDYGYGQGRPKNISRATVRVYKSGSFSVGPDDTRLTDVKPRGTEAYSQNTALVSDEVVLNLTPSWSNNGGQVFIRHTEPLSLTVVSVATEYALGG